MSLSDTEYSVAFLTKDISQVPLDVVFYAGELVEFCNRGDGTVHLNGHVERGEDESDDEGFDDVLGEPDDL